MSGSTSLGASIVGLLLGELTLQNPTQRPSSARGFVLCVGNFARRPCMKRRMTGEIVWQSEDALVPLRPP